MPQGLAEELRSIPMSPNLGSSLERAHRFAREQMHRHVMLEHLLLSLTEDPEASLILQSANVDLQRLATDVSAYLGSLLDDMRSDGSAEPRPDGELLRVLQAAASAAQQSKRRQIDGAIVLAAIVGDGKSPAAGMLKTHGMTFEEAIRALQRANTKARLKPIAKPDAPASVAAPPARAEPQPPHQATHQAAPARPAAAKPAPEPQAPHFAADVDAITVAGPHEPEAPAKPAVAPGGVQSADDILAAARARIQRRTASVSASSPSLEAETPSFATPPERVASQAAPGTRPAPPAEAPHASQHAQAPAPDQVPNAMRELLAATGLDGQRGAEARPGFDAGAPPDPAGRETVVPLRPKQAGPEAPPAAAFAAPGPGGVIPAPLRPPGPTAQDQHALRPEPPAPRTAPPSGIAPAAGPAPTMGPPGPAPLAPASGLGSVTPGAKTALQVDRRQLKRASAPLPPIQAPQQRKAGAAERGPLVEAIPRRMQLDVTSEGEVRIAQERIEGLITALAGRGRPQVNEPVVMRALTVRLRVQDGAFNVEPLSAETQWLDPASLAPSAEPFIWRWAITPRQRGKGKLVLLVSLRSLGADGSSEEVGPPDRLVEIKIRGRGVRNLMRRLLFVAMLAGAFVLGKLGGALWPVLVRTVREVTGL